MKRISILVLFVLAFYCTPIQSNGQVGAAALMTKLGNVDVTPQAEALAKVYVDYIRKDMEIYFFDRFAQLMNNDPELSVMFPATSTYLDNIPNYQYTNMLSAMRSAFYKDLRTLPRDITQITAMDTASCCNSAKHKSECQDRIVHYQSEFNTNKGKLLILSLLAADGFINKANGAVVLNNMANSPYIYNGIDTISNIVRLINVFSISMINPKQGKTWMGCSDLRAIFNDATQRTNFINKLVDSLTTKQINLPNGQLSSIVANIRTNPTNLEGYLDSLATWGNYLDTSFRKLRLDTSKANRNQNIAQFIENFNQFFVCLTNYNSVDPSIHIDNETRLIFNSMSDAFEISKDILVKDYQSAVFTCLTLVDNLFPAEMYTDNKGRINIPKPVIERRNSAIGKIKLQGQSIEDSTKKSLKAPSKEDLIKIGLQVQSSQDSMKKAFIKTKYDTTRGIKIQENRRLYTASKSSNHKKIDRVYSKYVVKPENNEIRSDIEYETKANYSLKHNFLKYGSLVAAVVSSDSASQITKAIEQVALPPSSSVIKRTTNFSIAVQGYAGFTAGCLGNGFNGNQFKSFNSLSPYAPLGVSFSTSLRSRNPSNKRTYGSVSLSLSLIDIGALVAYDLKNNGEKTQDSISIKLANIFAPGANLVYGIPGIPISFGGGFQYQPEMQHVSTSGTTINANTGFRWQIFAAFDLTLFNLYVSKR